MNVELSNVPVQSLVPEPLRDVKSADEYMQAGVFPAASRLLFNLLRTLLAWV